MYSIWNCNLVCIRNSAHVNKTLLRLHTLSVFELIFLHVCEHDIDFLECSASTGTVLTQGVDGGGISSLALTCDVDPQMSLTIVFQRGSSEKKFPASLTRTAKQAQLPGSPLAQCSIYVSLR